MRRIRCAIYTRKSSEEGLEQDFNSLDAQREACEAYITSQKHEGWEVLPERYDDGGISGGHLDRPALQRLMQAVGDKRVDQIVVYKIDRLTRSLTDFAKLVDRLDQAETSFVSVTQSFNTATSMGRLTLNMLLSFAQFEREVTAERIRDKIAASKRKGLWMGGYVPLGYEADGRTLKVNTDEVETIKTLYELFLEHRIIRKVKEHADQMGLKSRLRTRGAGRVSGGNPFDRGHIHHILTNPIYAGRIRHKDQVFDGQHPAIIDPEQWVKVQQILEASAAKGRGTQRKAPCSPLAGKLFDETSDRLTPSHSRKNGKRLRYYISHRLVKDRSQTHPDAWRLPAEPLERMIDDLIRQRLTRTGMAAKLMRDASAVQIESINEKLRSCQSQRTCLNLLERADIRRGAMNLQMDQTQIANLLSVEAQQLDPDQLLFEAPFQLRRRGVELKLHLGERPNEVDQTLARNISKAQRWLAMVIEGKSFAEIAKAENTPKRRVHDVINLALMSPELLDAVAQGQQPTGLTSDHLIKTGLPADWAEQRQLFGTL